MRTFFIWFFGLFAGAIVGGLIGARLETGYSISDGGFLGFIAGAFTFACVRLWLGQARP